MDGCLLLPFLPYGYIEYSAGIESEYAERFYLERLFVVKVPHFLLHLGDSNGNKEDSVEGEISIKIN